MHGSWMEAGPSGALPYFRCPLSGICLAGLVLRDERAVVGWADGGSHSGFRIEEPAEL